MGITETYKEFESRNLKYIADCNKEIGLMIRVKTTFKADSTIQQLCNYFISVNTYEMEELYGEIEQYREVRKELN